MHRRVSNPLPRPAPGSAGRAAGIVIASSAGFLHCVAPALLGAEGADARAEGSRAQARAVANRAKFARRSMPTSSDVTGSVCSYEMRNSTCSPRAGNSKRAREMRLQSESQLRELEREHARREQRAGRRACGALPASCAPRISTAARNSSSCCSTSRIRRSVGRTLAWYGYFGRARAGRIDGIREKLASTSRWCARRSPPKPSACAIWSRASSSSSTR